jgi:hypothetical protein
MKILLTVVLFTVFYCSLAWVSMWAFLMSDPNEADSINETDSINEDWN